MWASLGDSLGTVVLWGDTGFHHPPASSLQQWVESRDAELWGIQGQLPCSMILRKWFNLSAPQFKKPFTEVQLSYNVLISGVQQRDAVTHTHIKAFFFIFFSITVYNRILSMIPSARHRYLSILHILACTC